MLTLEERGGYSWTLRGTEEDVKKQPQTVDKQQIPINSVIYMQDKEAVAYLDEDRVWKRKGVPIV